MPNFRLSIILFYIKIYFININYLKTNFPSDQTLLRYIVQIIKIKYFNDYKFYLILFFKVCYVTFSAFIKKTLCLKKYKIVQRRHTFLILSHDKKGLL